MTCPELILECLNQAQYPMSIEQIGEWVRKIKHYSDNNIGTRLPELALAGKVVGEKAPGKPYKLWRRAGTWVQTDFLQV